MKAKGIWKEFVGICVSIDENKKCAKFASHGDYMVRVKDSGSFEIGDELFVNDEGDIEVLSEDAVVTSKIRRTIVGIVTSIVSEDMVAVFKS